jgi:putative ABC transport system substrate-binding protein
MGMQRREFVSLLGGALAGTLSLPSVVGAQPPMLRVGTTSPTERAAGFTLGFERRMRELGYVEGNNFEFVYRLLDRNTMRSDLAMQDFVRNKVDIILSFGSEASLKAAVAATKTIPIVMVAIDYDPIARGYVASLARPGGNVTGLFLEQLALAAKRVQLIKEAFPKVRTAAVFWDRFSRDQWHVTKSSADGLGLRLAGVELAHYPYDYDRALAQAPDDHRNFLIAMTSPLFARDRERLAQFTVRKRIASMFVFREYVTAGGLMSYGPSREAMSRRAADYVNRIARGAKPSELPVERPTRFEMVINLKTAKLIGLEFSQAMLLRADDVLE